MCKTKQVCRSCQRNVQKMACRIDRKNSKSDSQNFESDLHFANCKTLIEMLRWTPSLKN